MPRLSRSGESSPPPRNRTAAGIVGSMLWVSIVFPLVSGTVLAGVVPDPAQSLTPACINVSPANVPGAAFSIDVTVIGTDGSPLGGEEVRVIFDELACPELVACPSDTLVLAATTDAFGNVVFEPRIGGCCTGTAVCRIEADPGAVVLATYDAVGSPDLDGNLIFDIVDECLFAGLWLSEDPCADYDCTGVVDLADRSIFQTEVTRPTCGAPPIAPQDGTLALTLDHQRPPGFPDCSDVDPSSLSCATINSEGVAPSTLSTVWVYATGVQPFDGVDGGFSGVRFGIDYDPTVTILGFQTCLDFEVPTASWPDAGSGVTVAACVQPIDTPANADGIVPIGFFVVAQPASSGRIWITEHPDLERVDIISSNLEFSTVLNCRFGTVTVGESDPPCESVYSQFGSDCARCTGPFVCILPWDNTGVPFVSPGDPDSGLGMPSSDHDDVVITLIDGANNPVVGVPVEILFEDCPTLCVDSSPYQSLVGFTNADGFTTINPRVGGCARPGGSCTVTVRVLEDVLRTFNSVVSTDWDGFRADGVVDDVDLLFYNKTAGEYDFCIDYDPNGVIDGEDTRIIFETRNDRNHELCCEGAECAIPDLTATSVEPWDTLGFARVSPGSGGAGAVTVTAFDVAGRPMEGARVRLRLDYCDGLCFDGDTAHVQGIIGSDGTVTISPAVGGCSADCRVTVFVNGYRIEEYTQVVSFDLNADGVVDSLDEDELAGLFGTSDPCGDFDGNGIVNLSDTALLFGALGDANDGPCVVAVPGGDPAPRPLGLSVPSPNPTRGPLAFEVTLATDARVTLDVFDVSGRRAAKVYDGVLAAGSQLVHWAPDRVTGEFATGVYFLKLQTPEGTFVQRFTVVR